MCQKAAEVLSKATEKPIVVYPNDFVDFDKDWVVTEAGDTHIPHMDTPA